MRFTQRPVGIRPANRISDEARKLVGTVGTVVLAVLVSWGISWHVPVSWAKRAGEAPVTTPVLLHAQVSAVPDAPLCVPVGRRGSRRYYELAFRSDHPVHFVRPKDTLECARQHPDGLVIARKRDRWRPTGRPSAEASDARWYGWRASTVIGADEGSVPGTAPE